MTRIWIGLAVVIWLGTYAVAADGPTGDQRRITPNPTVPADKVEKVQDLTAVPASAARGSAARSRGDVGGARPAASATVEPVPVASVPVVPEKDGEHRHTRMVLRLSNVPAVNLSNTINTLLRAEGQASQGSLPNVVIVSDTVSNSLVVGGPIEAVDVVRKLVAELDHAARMILLEVVIGDVPPAKSESGTSGDIQSSKADEGRRQAGTARPEDIRHEMEILIQAQLTTLDNQPAYLQVGRREPRIMSANVTPQGRTNSFTVENVGTIVTFTPRVGIDGKVALQLDIEDSRLGPMEEGLVIFAPSEGEAVRSPYMDSLKVQTTLHIPDGQTVVVSGMARQKAGKQRVILVTPHVLPIGGEAKHAK